MNKKKAIYNILKEIAFVSDKKSTRTVKNGTR